ncbi:cytochrome C552 [Caldimicrobium thiodismutans]|uniref:Cytochrome C552 n=1 Tax=Caldimicrobium thiodismutans TaxID=1653476 RepID=A0A0U4W453_9BACT|nr:c-type cytochrome [Caldimicrobium thiodismutans]BAU23869.1 cytochrome C552 [Caldimicrobium thiodismutans]
MKKSVLLMALIFLPTLGFASNGEEIFKTKGCGGCHSKEYDSFAPSLKTISKSYYKKNQELKDYLQGKKPGLIKGEPKTMKGFINITKKLSEKDLSALIEYLLSF